MKVAFSASGEGLDAAMDSRFGRAPFFVVVDVAGGAFTVLDNSVNAAAGQGAGIKSAELVLNEGVAAVVTGHCGPKAFRVLSGAGIVVYNCGEGSVGNALELLKAGKLNVAESSDVAGHW